MGKLTSLVIAACLACACGPKSMGSQQAAGWGHKLRVAKTSTGWTFDWDRCEEFGIKRCGDKIKVTTLTVIPLNCTVGGEVTGKRPIMWFVMAAGDQVGAHLKPPIDYGQAPEGTKADPAKKLLAGCRYLASVGIVGEQGSSDVIEKEIAW